MKRNALGYVTVAVSFFLVLIPAVFVLKFILGAHMTFISFKDKTALYALAALWNACFAYFMFGVL